MSENSPIEWTDHTFNPWWGCAKVSPGCDHCYAEALAHRYMPGQVLWGVKHEAPRRVFEDKKHWFEPMRWNRKATEAGRRERVFCASMADVFDNHPVADEYRPEVWSLIHKTQQLDWLLLTKRVGNVERMVPPSWLKGYWPANAWLGISVVNQEEADRDIPKLLALPARVRFLSCEPLLGPIDLSRWLQIGRCKSRGGGFEGRPLRCGLPAGHDDDHSALIETSAPWFSLGGELRWVIGGGESGPKARPMHPDWARGLRDQCAAAGVPFLFKQWGEFVSVSEVEGPGAHFHFPDGPTVRRTGKKLAGRLLDGRLHDGFPA